MEQGDFEFNFYSMLDADIDIAHASPITELQALIIALWYFKVNFYILKTN